LQVCADPHIVAVGNVARYLEKTMQTEEKVYLMQEGKEVFFCQTEDPEETAMMYNAVVLREATAEEYERRRGEDEA
jgi:hypothetical protein